MKVVWIHLGLVFGIWGNTGTLGLVCRIGVWRGILALGRWGFRGLMFLRERLEGWDLGFDGISGFWIGLAFQGLGQVTGFKFWGFGDFSVFRVSGNLGILKIRV